jgi:hypothetical protein
VVLDLGVGFCAWLNAVGLDTLRLCLICSGDSRTPGDRTLCGRTSIAVLAESKRNRLSKDGGGGDDFVADAICFESSDICIVIVFCE